MGHSDLTSGNEEHRPGAPRGLVVLPATAADGRVPGRRSTFLGRWAVLIATLLAGVAVLVIIAVLWSGGSGNPDPRSLPPAAAAPARASGSLP